MKTIEIKLYEYTELSQEAKERALKDWNEDNYDPFMQSYMINVLKDKSEERKLEYETDSIDVRYSLSSSQGDGFMFEGIFQFGAYSVTVEHSGQYYHSNSKTIDIVHSETHEQAPRSVYKAFEEVYQNICKEMEQIGYDYIEYEQSEENFIVTCESNEYTFEEDGKMRNV